jgi:hypothetical protein
VDPRQLEEIMSQGHTRPETPRDREERRVLEADLADSPVKGRPLRQRLRNFRTDADAAIRALGGPTVWMRRLRAIEEELEGHDRQLEAAWRGLAEDAADPAQFARLWRDTARHWSFAEVNELIERHNRNFPAEARLPMDPRTRDFVQVNGRPYRREPLDAEWILARFPADLRAARRLTMRGGEGRRRRLCRRRRSRHHRAVGRASRRPSRRTRPSVRYRRPASPSSRSCRGHAWEPSGLLPSVPRFWEATPAATPSRAPACRTHA